MVHSALATRAVWTHQQSSRDGARIDRFIVHHAATTSLQVILNLFAGARQVSAQYALKDRDLVATVPEERRAWTSGSYQDDRRAVTIEVANSQAGGAWPVSDESFDTLARLIADVSARYDFPITDDTVLTHQELWTRFRRSYATACPGDLQRRKGELLDLARHYRSNTPQEEDEMNADQDARLKAVERDLRKILNVMPVLHQVNRRNVTIIEQNRGVARAVERAHAAVDKVAAAVAEIAKAVVGK